MVAHHDSIPSMALVAFQPYGVGLEADIAKAVAEANARRKKRRTANQAGTSAATTGDGASPVAARIHTPVHGGIPKGAPEGADPLADAAEAEAYQANLMTGCTSNGKFDQKEVTCEWEENSSGVVLYSVVSQSGRTEFLVSDDVKPMLLAEWENLSHAEKDKRAVKSDVPNGHRLLEKAKGKGGKGNAPSDIVLGEWSMRRLWARATNAKCYGQGCQNKFKAGGDKCLVACP